MSPPEDLRIVPLTQDDSDEVLRLDQAAFAFPLAEVDAAQDLTTFEWDRTFAAVRRAAGPHRHARSSSWADDEELAGLMTSYSLQITVPDRGVATRSVPVAGLSWVSVHPDHRRRGVLTEMIRHHLHGLHDGGEAVSGLFASEAAIYGRFGYGESAPGLSLTVPTGSALRPVAGTEQVATQMTSASADGALALVQDVYDQAWPARVGRMSRPVEATTKLLEDRPERHPGAELKKLIVARRDGRPTGYALVQRKMAWAHGTPKGRADLLELVGLDPASEHALWSRLIGLDLVTEVDAPTLGPDDPLLTWLVDLRSCAATRTDALWLRLVDVDRALVARGYATDVDVVFELTDRVCPWNAGCWRLRVAGADVTCERADGEPAVRLDVRELAATYLGRSLSGLAATGLVDERSPGAVAALSAALRAPAEPAVPPMF
jgi:predicted acetyltransferase